MTHHEQIALVDISYTFRRYWHTQAESAERNDAALRTMQFLETAENVSGHVIVCKDSPPYKRSEVFPQYKGQRAKASEELCAARRDLMERISLGGWRCASVPGAEADDIIATLCDELIEMDLAGQVWIMGCDKDLYQCVGDRVSMAIPSGGNDVVHMTPQSVFDKWGVHPAQVPEFLGLVGDKADNIPGCPQVGEKTAARILSEYGGISNALAVALKEPEQFASAMKSAVLGPRLLENKDNVLLSWRLASLERKVFDGINDPPRIDTLLQPRQPVPLRVDVPAPADESEERHEDGEQSRAVEEQTREVGSCGREGVTVAPDYGGGAIVQQTEIVQQRPPAWELGLEPRGHERLVWMCQRLQESGLYPKLRWQGIYAIALKGRSLGMSIMNALDSINIIQGKPAMGWQAIVAFAQQHPDCQYFFQVSCDATQSTWETKRRGNPRAQQRQYTIQDARTAGLVQRRSPWETHPADMLSKTAAVKLARAVYYDSRAQGLYCAEEMGVTA